MAVQAALEQYIREVEGSPLKRSRKTPTCTMPEHSSGGCVTSSSQALPFAGNMGGRIPRTNEKRLRFGGAVSVRRLCYVLGLALLGLLVLTVVEAKTYYGRAELR